jgi:Uma2 family endonuclease
MRAVIVDSHTIEELVKQRKSLGTDRWDEVWRGEWHLSPSPSWEHQRMEKAFLRILTEVVEDSGLGEVIHQFNVADPAQGLQDFRIPDISVVLQGSHAQVRETFIAGGPDLLLEIYSPGDETYQKIDWYGEQGVRELIIINRDTKGVELYRHDGESLKPVGTSPSGSIEAVESTLLPLRFETLQDDAAPRLRIQRLESPHRSWVV